MATTLKRLFLILLTCIVIMSPGIYVRADVFNTSESAGTGQMLVSVRGSYTLDAEALLEDLNRIRYEACTAGNVPDPRDPSRMLTESDYVPLTWSGELEYIARVRAAEASAAGTAYSHKRPNGTYCFTVTSPAGVTAYGEDLAWNSASGYSQSLGQFEDEKADWIKGNTEAETGHYTNIIDPDMKTVGGACFYSSDSYWGNTTSLEFSQRPDIAGEAMEDTEDTEVMICVQTDALHDPQVITENVVKQGSYPDRGSTGEAVLTAVLGDGFDAGTVRIPDTSWTSSDESIVTFDMDSVSEVSGISASSSEASASSASAGSSENSASGDNKFVVLDAGTVMLTGTGSGFTATYLLTSYHTLVTEPEQRMTRKLDGRTAGAYCTTCGEVISRSHIIPRHGFAVHEIRLIRDGHTVPWTRKL